ncbi:hypothetical protein [Liquorilactobacillus satsumensis]|uniref:hypothetical protein n=1 Tax=Liquorilactobacillus satsumensis TaxID=259059 RepID=UPI0039EB13F9
MGNFISSMLGGIIVAIFSAFLAEHREKNREIKKEIRNIINLVGELMRNKNNVTMIFEPNNKEQAIYTYNEFIKSIVNLEDEENVIGTYELDKRISDELKEMIRLSKYGANNYYQAYIAGGDTAEVAQNNVTYGKWKKEIEEKYKNIITLLSNKK